MSVTPDRPSVGDLERLERAVASEPVDASELVSSLRQVEQALRRHGRDLDRAGGLLDEEERAARPSLDRQAEALRQEVNNLNAEVAILLGQAQASGASRMSEEVRDQARQLLTGLQRLRDAEAGVALESVETDIGAGD